MAPRHDYFCWTRELKLIASWSLVPNPGGILFVEVEQLEIQEPTTIAIRAVHFYGSNDTVEISVKQYCMNDLYHALKSNGCFAIHERVSHWLISSVDRRIILTGFCATSIWSRWDQRSESFVWLNTGWITFQIKSSCVINPKACGHQRLFLLDTRIENIRFLITGS
jgi:uncharacterized CHY-type Zn-finger protein